MTNQPPERPEARLSKGELVCYQQGFKRGYEQARSDLPSEADQVREAAEEFVAWYERTTLAQDPTFAALKAALPRTTRGEGAE